MVKEQNFGLEPIFRKILLEPSQHLEPVVMLHVPEHL
jgi:hypothetical protein